MSTRIMGSISIDLTITDEPDEGGDTPAVTVIGAGSGAANGTYTERGTHNGKPFYNPEGQLTSETSFFLNWSSGEGITSGWVLFNDGDELYRANEEVDFPWLATTWLVADGATPAPTVTEG